MRMTLWFLLCVGFVGSAIAQEALPPDVDAIARATSGGQPSPPAAVKELRSWVEPTEPVKIVDSLYFVGTRGLAAYLITTSDGHILIDGAVPSAAEHIEASIRTLGFQPEAIRLLLITHAHVDHVGTTAHFKKLSGAKFAVMEADAATMKSAGTDDFHYATQPAFYFPPVTADRVLKDGDTVALGDVTLTARLGAGHTRGATTWTTRIKANGRTYIIVFPCCTSVNPGYRLVVNPSYPGIAADFRRTIAMLESLKPDIWLPAHPNVFGFEGKRARAAKEGVQAWVDPDGYGQWVAKGKANFEALVAKEN